MTTTRGKDIYKSLTGLPSYTSAQFAGDGVIIVTSSVQDHLRNTKRSFTKTLLYAPGKSESDLKVSRSLPQDTSSDVKSTLHSPSGASIAILRETSGDSGKKRFVEIWSAANSQLEAQLEVTSVHGAFYSSPDFHSLSFSPSETALVYTAEANDPTAENEDPYARFRYVPDGGESMTGLKRPTLFVARWRIGSDSASTTTEEGPDMTILTLELPNDKNLKSPVIFGQAVFAGEDSVVATGYKYTEDFRRLGTKGCFNRPSAIWELKFDAATLSKASTAEPAQKEKKSSALTVTSSAIVSDSSLSARSPRVHTDKISGKTTVFWLAHVTGGPHAACSALHSFDLETRKHTSLIPIVSKPDTFFMDGFVGLFPDSGLPSRPFLSFSGKRYLITPSAEGARSNVILIDADKPCSVTHLTRKTTITQAEDPVDWSWNVLGTDGEKSVLCWRSTASHAPELVLGIVDASSSSPTVRWRTIDKVNIPEKLKAALSSLKVSIVPIPDRSPFETILIEHGEADQQSKAKRPLITVVHGGPHGSNQASFNPAILALALQGYTVSLPNFTGSLGYGDEFVQQLVGKCGTLDVDDVMASIKYLLEIGVAVEGPGKQFVQGGSHGGFITGHLLGQYPGFFSAAVLRNPVITPEPSSTDIPEWYYYEFGLPFSATTLLTPSEYGKLWPMSPISHVDKVKAPVLLCLGLEDRRVANTHGMAFYHALKGRGRDVEMLQFKGESHPLEGVEASRVSWEAGADLFEKHRI
ncbi:alpha/beta-hydrolase [Stereum hirsutum FP-91666 SS1]|uniref:alpha/beta-hydrolase n=1 Tax=Stereum hirsutum (strain FP-91666) TaxID=721885 RepID=UPI000440ED92|nr:alpha/beta-hydrolase [Stereum hirsutum FP-91666 SS1]EIM89231.1 alpha/beta-hydrolase [Stereum hirsutum FP-91666 SS1]